MESYAAVPYDARPITQAHPDRLAVIARMFGLTPKAPQRGRILDLGCADGSHLLALALEYPDSECVGIDNSPEQIASGQRTAQALGVTNLSLRVADIADPGDGEFDYVTAHGVYSWVDAATRERLLETVGRCLASNGLGYLSYEVLPGAQPRLAVRDLLLPLVRDLDAAAVGVRFRSLATALAEGIRDDHPFPAALKAELLRASRAADSAVAHDWCSNVHDAVYFRDFAAQLAQHGLAFLSDTPLLRSSAAALPASARRVVTQLGNTRSERQQMIDILGDNSYRESLLVRAGRDLPDEPDFLAELPTARISVSLALQRAPDGALLLRNHRGWQTTVTKSVVQAAVVSLAQASPAPLSLADLAGALDDSARRELCQGLFELFSAGFIDLRRDPPRHTSSPGQRPQASALCRWQGRHGSRLTDLEHHSVRIEEERSRKLLELLDGTRDRTRLQADWSGLGSASELDQYLERFAKLRLLLA